MTIGPGGVIYGTTPGGGTSQNWGTVYALTPPASPGGAWTKATVYEFQGGADGLGPDAPVTVGSGGVLYGTTTGNHYLNIGCGGLIPSLDGTLCSLTPPSSAGGAWTETVLYHFNDAKNGACPNSALVVSQDGTIYGTTAQGGSGYGVVFALRPPASPGDPWTYTDLYHFGDTGLNGPGPGFG